ncbi:hypothetical protein J6590_012435 [Homalodisca vitripennis]|nr:hypothetical protein J6590_012435 [Homalodisca vitripennis]
MRLQPRTKLNPLLDAPSFSVGRLNSPVAEAITALMSRTRGKTPRRRSPEAPIRRATTPFIHVLRCGQTGLGLVVVWSCD